MLLGVPFETTADLLFIWLVLSLAVMFIQEWVASILGWRSNMLETYISNLLADPTLAKQFYNHPLIQSLHSGLDGDHKPSYIPSVQFSATLFDIIRNAPKDASLIQKTLYNLQGDINNLSMNERALAQQQLELILNLTYKALETEAGEEMVDSILDEAKGQIRKLSADYPALQPVIEEKFQEFASQKEQINGILASMQIHNSAEPAFRTLDQIRVGLAALSVTQPQIKQAVEALLSGVEEYTAKGNSSLLLASLNVENWFDNGMDRLNGWYKRRAQVLAFVISFMIVGLLNIDTIQLAQKPLGNTITPQLGWISTALPDDPVGWMIKLSGLALSGLVVGMGAPIWFEVFNKLVNLRAAGLKPATSQDRRVVLASIQAPAPEEYAPSKLDKNPYIKGQTMNTQSVSDKVSFQDILTAPWGLKTATGFMNNVTSILKGMLSPGSGDVEKIAASQIQLLSSYYVLVLQQAQRSFTWALVWAGVGLLAFLAAGAFVLGNQSKDIALIGTIGGALVEFISGINFYLYNKASTQLVDFHTRLDQTQKVLLANTICEKVEGELKQKTRASLALKFAGIEVSDEWFEQGQPQGKTSVRITRIEFDPDGLEFSNEYARIENQGSLAADLMGWSLVDAAGHVFRFPAFLLKPSMSVTVWSKMGRNDVTNLFWKRKAPVWNNTGDTAYLKDSAGNVVDCYHYARAAQEQRPTAKAG